MRSTRRASACDSGAPPRKRQSAALASWSAVRGAASCSVEARHPDGTQIVNSRCIDAAAAAAAATANKATATNTATATYTADTASAAIVDDAAMREASSAIEQFATDA
eukprot:2356990-Pleurochrysis_carterae.AAC.1